MIWYRKLGFHSNPFSIKPAAYDFDVVAFDMDYIYEKIENGEMLFIEGLYGTGKTSILKNIISRFRGRNKLIYYNFNTASDFSVPNLINGANSFLRKVSGLRVKNIIMLLDEAHSMKTSDAKELISYYKDGTIQSVIFVSHDYGNMKLPDEYEYYLNGNILRTIHLSNEEAVDFIRSRLGALDIINDANIIRVFKLSDKNPRRLLEYCEDIIRYAVEIGDDEVTDFHINEILSEVIKETKKPAKQAKKPAAKEEVKLKAPEKEEVKLDAKPVKEAVKLDTVEKVKAETKDEVKLENDKKFKINKLVDESKKNSLGVIAKEEPAVEKKEGEDETPEYQVYFMD